MSLKCMERRRSFRRPAISRRSSTKEEFLIVRKSIICWFVADHAFKLNICCEAFFAGNHEAANAIIIAVKATRIKSVTTNLTGK